jgi:hypothetical protein
VYEAGIVCRETTGVVRGEIRVCIVYGLEMQKWCLDVFVEMFFENLSYGAWMQRASFRRFIPSEVLVEVLDI